MAFNESKFIQNEQPSSKLNFFEIEAGESKKVKIIEGSIADSQEESIFFLNLEDNEFPAPGPVFEKLLDKDAELKENNSSGDTINELVLKAAKNIQGANMVEVEDEISETKYEKAVFTPKPYAITEVDVVSANWPKLRTLFFGNIGSDEEGILVRIWKPTVEQTPKLKQELTTLLENLFEELKEKGIKSVAMPVLTGHRAPSEIFYQTLNEIIKSSGLPADLTIYAYGSEDFEKGKQVLQE